MEARAQARNVRVSPMKARRVVDLIRGMGAQDALVTLQFAPQAASEPVGKVLASAVANAATSVRAVKKYRLAMAICTPMSRTRIARPANSASSASGRPNSLVNSAPPMLKRSVIWVLMSEFSCICWRVKPARRRPIHFAGRMNSGTSTSAASVICHDSANIVTSTITRLMRLPRTPDNVDVKACWAPITSLLSRDTNAPVWVLVKNAIGCRWTWE